jgi:hypothetical protein
MNPVVIIGIDPGLDGAIAVLRTSDGKPLGIADIPTKASSGFVKRKVDGRHLGAILSDLVHGSGLSPDQCLVVLELVQSIGGKEKGGRVSTFSLAHTMGSVEAVVDAAGLPLKLIQPRTWKAALGLGTEKTASRTLALTLYGKHDEVERSLARVKDHNRAEALLLAHWAREFIRKGYPLT